MKQLDAYSRKTKTAIEAMMGVILISMGGRLLMNH
jgi:hypothetical protein